MPRPTKLARLTRQMIEARNAIDAIETEERRKAAAPLVGKCFTYRNSYSMPETDVDYWLTYYRVIGVGDDGQLQVFRFQVDKYGTASIGGVDHRLWAHQFTGSGSGFTEIGLYEFALAWVDFQRVVSGFAQHVRKELT